ncbi:sialidase family protein [Caldifermentibacillus hisashii]|uniref:Sialidase family protein n=1 Tax=Caldifermentibacillus hisashii TaxID=996558 RepID=A0ABU9K2U5_9BACI
MVRLSNGWLVAGVKDTSATPYRIVLYVSKDNGGTWQQLAYLQDGSAHLRDFALANKDTYIYWIVDRGGVALIYGFVDATTATGNVFVGSNVVDGGLTGIGNVSLVINEAGTELHAAWASKNSTYPNSFNIRYAKGTINADGSITWGAVEQVTNLNNASYSHANGITLILDSNNVPTIFTGYFMNTSTYIIYVIKKSNELPKGSSYNINSGWTGEYLYQLGGYIQTSPSAIFVPSSVNGLPNGLLGTAWHGTDSASGGVNYIRFSKSTDLGANWSAPQKLVPGTNLTLTANRNGKLFITYEDNGVTKRIESTDNGDTWSAPITVGNGTNPSSLFDLTLNMSEPLTIRKGTLSVLFKGSWVVTTISVPEGYIGQKTSSDKSNILTYSITAEGTMSDITEKINGVTIATRTNPTSGQQFTVSLTQEQWDAIKYGNGHTLTIEMGSETWTYTFDKRLNTNDDILSAVKGVQDLQDHLNAVKAQLGSAIRANGGTVNDTDAWSVFVSAVSNMTNKRWASGTTTSSSSTLSFSHADGTGVNLSYVEVTGLNFTPSCILIYSVTNTNSITILYPENIWSGQYPIRIIATQYVTYGSGTVNSRSMKLEGNAYVSQGVFRLPHLYQNKTIKWIAFE